MSLPAHLMSASDETFALSGLDALLATAARSTPGGILVRDDAGGADATQLSRRARVLAERFRLSGLRRGERVLVLATPQTATLVAMIAAVRAGLEPALARPGLNAIELAAHASAAEAVAMLGPAGFGEPLGETYLSAAALCQGIRLIATHGPEPVDGALDVSDAALDASSEPPPGSEEPPLEMPLIATFAGRASEPRLISHRQATLFADALSLVEQARIDPTRRVLSLLMPASRAGLVAGPFAALVGASELVMHGPFEARGFLALLDAEPSPHVVAPAALGPLLADEALTRALSSLVLVSRYPDFERFTLPEPLHAACPIADLYVFGEEIVLAQRRIDGEARAPNRVADRSVSDGLGARLNRARAEHRLHGGEG